MKIIIYIIRFLLALFFIYVAIDRFINPMMPQDEIGLNTEFIAFYALLLKSNFIYFVCVCELVCGALLLLKRTYLLGAIMFVPLLLCLLMTHVFISKNSFYLIFDISLFFLNSILIVYRYKELKQVFFKPQQGWI